MPCWQCTWLLGVLLKSSATLSLQFTYVMLQTWKRAKSNPRIKIKIQGIPSCCYFSWLRGSIISWYETKPNLWLNFRWHACHPLICATHTASLWQERVSVDLKPWDSAGWWDGRNSRAAKEEQAKESIVIRVMWASGKTAGDPARVPRNGRGGRSSQQEEGRGGSNQEFLINSQL